MLALHLIFLLGLKNQKPQSPKKFKIKELLVSIFLNTFKKIGRFHEITIKESKV